MLMLLVASYTSHTASAILSQLAELKRARGILFVIASITSRSPYSAAVLDFLLSARASQSSQSPNLLFAVPVWGFDGTLVDLLYSSEAAWFGDLATLPVVAAKIRVDQFGYNPLFAAPFWRADPRTENSGISLQPIRDLFAWIHYRNKIIPTLLATWAV